LNIHRVRFCALFGDPPEMIISYKVKIKSHDGKDKR